MTVVSNLDLELDTESPQNLQVVPITGADIASLLDSKIVVAGARVSDVAYMKTMLEISGFNDISVAHNGKDVMTCLRTGIHNDFCDIDLIVLDSSLEDMTARELRVVMNQFDEWQLIPIISLTQESQWDHAQALTDLGHGVTSLQYHPLTAESFQGKIAEEIIKVARAHGVPLREDGMLAALLGDLELDEEIPPVLYRVIAEVIAYAYLVSEKVPVIKDKKDS